MKIKSVEIKEGSMGLKAVKMEGLGSVVLLTGPNGAGKTRLLRYVNDLANKKKTPYQIGEIKESIRSDVAFGKMQEDAFGKYRNDPEKKYQTEKLDKKLAIIEDNVKVYNEMIEESGFIEVDVVDRNPLVVNYNLRGVGLEDWRESRVAQILRSRQIISASFDPQAIRDGVMAMHALAEESILCESPTYNVGEDYRVRTINDYKTLRKLFLDVLGAEIDFTYQGGLTIYGRPVMDAGLSEGQLILFKLVVSVFFQNGDLEDLVIILDEPENHLHPSSAIELIERLQSACPKAQLWVATHSLHVIAHFNDVDIWFVKNGEVKRSGKHSVEVMSSLTGGEAGLENLSRFLMLPAEYTAIKFASECLLPPDVVDTAAGDPQTNQIQKIISKISNRDAPLRVLDIGMGKGRLLNELVEFYGDNMPGKIDYFGLNLFAVKEDKASCLEKISNCYKGDGVERYFDSVQKMKEYVDPGSIDLAVMCNVLHEIEPSDWLLIFGESGYLSARMSNSGYLLIVEDEMLKVGERAHSFDFLVMTRNEIVTLFKAGRMAGDVLTVSHDNPRYRDRLRAHLINSKCIAHVDRQSVIDSMRELKCHAMERVRQIKGGDVDSKNLAKEYAFWVHQLANASLALNE